MRERERERESLPTAAAFSGEMKESKKLFVVPREIEVDEGLEIDLRRTVGCTSWSELRKSNGEPRKGCIVTTIVAEAKTMFGGKGHEA